jgi:hypothetical protein
MFQPRFVGKMSSSFWTNWKNRNVFKNDQKSTWHCSLWSLFCWQHIFGDLDCGNLSDYKLTTLTPGMIGIGEPASLSETTGALHAFNIPLVSVAPDPVDQVPRPRSKPLPGPIFRTFFPGKISGKIPRKIFPLKCWEKIEFWKIIFPRNSAENVRKIGPRCVFKYLLKYFWVPKPLFSSYWPSQSMHIL